MDTIEAFNQAFFLKINAIAATPAWKIHLAIILADYLVYMISLILLWMWLWGDETKRNMAIKAFIIAVLSLGVNQLIILVWQLRVSS